MKKPSRLWIAAILITTLLAGCGGAGPEPPSAPDTAGAAAGGGPIAAAYMTADEARAVLRAWSEGHPFQLGSELEPGASDVSADGKEYYRFALSVIRFGVVEVLVDKEAGTLFHFSSPGSDAFEPLDEWYEREHAEYAPKSNGGAPLTAEQARQILQFWLDGHPIEPPDALSLAYGERVEGGEAYYLFSLDNMGLYWVNFLVHKETGALFFLMVSDGEEPVAYKEPIDDWYNGSYGASG